MVEFEERYLPIENLLFDPNNYRFQDLEDFVYCDHKRMHEQNVQAKAVSRLRDEDGILSLKNSILKNTFIRSERLIVIKYENEFIEDKYLVIEGNRRLAACRWILSDSISGVTVPKEVLNSIEQMPVVIASGDQGEAAEVTAALMGIRHVSGVKQWGGYQRAKLIVDMRDNLQLSAPDVADRLGLSTQEVNRRYRAFKALQQLKDDEEYGEHFRPNMYPLFHEALALPAVRQWLDWDETSSKFMNNVELQRFYSLICPRDPEIAGTKSPKITTYDEIRELRTILLKPEATRVLIDEPSRSFVDALVIAKQDELSKSWIEAVEQAIRELTAMGIRDVKNLNEEDRHRLERLRSVIEERLQDYQNLIQTR